MILIAAVVPLGAVWLGWALSERSNSKRERRDLERRRSDFQRATILDLQETLADLARATSRIHHEDANAFIQTGTWGRGQVTDEWAEKQRDAFQRATVFQTRLVNDQLRGEVQHYQEVCYRVSVASDDVTANLALMDLQIAYSTVIEDLGGVLRRLP